MSLETTPRPGLALDDPRPAMQPWTKNEKILYAAMAMAYVVVRASGAIGVTAFRQPDTSSYFQFGLWGGTRLWTVPLVFRTLDRPGLIVTFHVVLGVLAWVSLAVVVLHRLCSARVRVLAALGILVLASTLPVVQWDVVLLSESIAISLSVLLTAVLIRMIGHIGKLEIVLFAAVYGTWVFTRQAHVFIGLVLILPMLVSRWVRIRRTPVKGAFKFLAATALVAIAISAFGYARASADNFVQSYNIAQILLTRINDHPDRLQWFEAHGMPKLPLKPGKRYEGTGADVNLLKADPAVHRWIQDNGFSTYAKFLVSHPVDTLLAPLHVGGGETSVVDSASAGSQPRGEPRRVMPSIVNTILWPSTQRDVAPLAIAVLASLALGTWCTRRARRQDALLLFFSLVLVAQVPNLWFIWHGAASDLGRLSIVPAILIRIALLGIALVAADRLCSRERTNTEVDDATTHAPLS